jgi:hypothetical protein
MRRAGLLLLCGLCVIGAVARAQAPAGERQRLAAERAAVDALYLEREAACQRRFAVTDCVNDAKKERRAALAPLRRLGAALDDAQRKQRAAQRQEDVRRKTENAQARDNGALARPAPALKAIPDAPADAGSAPMRMSREVKPAPVPKRLGSRPPPELPTEAERRAREADADARSAARKQSAQANREAVERRNAQRALSGKRADPLPVPASGVLP